MDKVYGSKKRIFLWMEKSVAPTVSGRWWWDKTFILFQLPLAIFCLQIIRMYFRRLKWGSLTRTVVFWRLKSWMGNCL